jgi:hypothetical protein
MSTTPTNLRAPGKPASSASGAAAPSCWCGQDLADVLRDHCPRCGRALAKHLECVVSLPAA